MKDANYDGIIIACEWAIAFLCVMSVGYAVNNYQTFIAHIIHIFVCFLLRLLRSPSFVRILLFK